MINGIKIQPLKIFKDERGAVLKMIDKNNPEFKEFGEMYFSQINPGVIKGWKKHLRINQLFAVPVGNMKLVLYDDREDSSTKGEIQEIEFGIDNYVFISLPPQVWYSWKALGKSPAIIANLINEVHDPEESKTADLNDAQFPYKWNTSETNEPTVSIIVNCYNSDEYLKETIDSIYAQTFSDWEIIFWDNGSTDQSANIAKNYNERVKYFFNPKTIPLGDARNKAIELAHGKYVSFIDCDDIWLPTKLEKQVQLLDSHDKYGMVYTNTTKFDGNYEVTDFTDKYLPPSGMIFKDLLKRNFITLSSVMCRNSILKSIDPVFDAKFHLSEDWDAWLKICYKSEAGYIHEALTKWRINQNSGTHKKFIIFGDETRILIESLKNMNPEIANKYKSELTNLEINAKYSIGLGLWFEDKCKESRKILRPHITCKLKFLLAYIATFMPQSFIIPLEKLYFKLRFSKFL
ncbi:glycosyltransferase [Candidatus Kuenenbacteria bacterium]|nr:glycosyltransferase [Candidatus Kuenenbacteria bacterium]